jgi:hypothetical protein
MPVHVATQLSYISIPFCSIRSELPEEQYEPLRSEIFKHILAFSGGPKIVLTRMCVAVSILNGLYNFQKKQGKKEFKVSFQLLVSGC